MIIDSPIGPLTLVERDGALARLSFGAHGTSASPTPLLERAASQLHAYFAGELREFNVPLAPSGTEFQLACWRALAEIPGARQLSPTKVLIPAPDAAQGLPPNIGLDNAMYDVARWSARCLLLLLRRVPSLTGACIYRTELTEP